MKHSELTPSERGEILWLSKSGYTPDAIARKTFIPLNVVLIILSSKIWRARHE
jgi:hypothetical protein